VALDEGLGHAEQAADRAHLCCFFVVWLLLFGGVCEECVCDNTRGRRTNALPNPTTT
jgi:hypothetical protein